MSTHSTRFYTDLTFSIDTYMQYKPDIDEEIDPKTMRYIRIGELVKDNVNEDTQLIVL